MSTASDHPSPEPSAKPVRLASIDAYRGLVMFLMLAEALHLCAVARHFPQSTLWELLCHHQSHVEWVGCSLHDLIQPSFSFLVGVALPFSIANRRARGDSPRRMGAHALWRALVLVALGIFLRSMRSSQTNFTFEDTLTQIGLGYAFLYLLGWRSPRAQFGAFLVILLAYWGAFALYPVPGPDFDYASVGVPADWPHLMTGFEAHWNKNSNLAWAFDTWFLNLFPRPRPFRYNGGGYATLSFIPTLATMVLGLMAGECLRSGRSLGARIGYLLIGSGACFLTGWGLGELGLCPVVKRIWTPSWALFSGGWCLLTLAGFHAVIDGLGLKALFYPLRVIGHNSIAAYLMGWMLEGFVEESIEIHLGKEIFEIAGPEYVPLLQGFAILTVFWLVLFWMDRRKIYLRI